MVMMINPIFFISDRTMSSTVWCSILLLVTVGGLSALLLQSLEIDLGEALISEIYPTFLNMVWWFFQVRPQNNHTEHAPPQMKVQHEWNDPIQLTSISLKEIKGTWECIILAKTAILYEMWVRRSGYLVQLGQVWDQLLPAHKQQSELRKEVQSWDISYALYSELLAYDIYSNKY